MAACKFFFSDTDASLEQLAGGPKCSWLGDVIAVIGDSEANPFVSPWRSFPSSGRDDSPGP